MSTHAKAARRPAVSFLLQRILSSVFGWFRAWRARRPAPTSARPSARFESLEPRLLMSADLVGAIPANAIPADVLPSETLNIPVTVQNIGRDAANLTPAVRVYASASGQLDSSAVVLGESATKSTQIKAGKSTTVNVGIDASKLAVPGNFTLFAVVDATGKVKESNESNNTAVGTKPLVVTWSFGNVPGHSNAESITLTDADGTRVTFKLTGAGKGEIVRDGNAFDLKLTGTNSSSALRITTSGGDGIARIDDIAVSGSLKEIIAGKADLTGALTVGGTLRTIELRNIDDGASIAITGTGVPVSLTAQRVTGASIVSASAFDSICIDEWRAGTTGRGVISAPSIASLKVDGDFAADLVLKGASSGNTLGSVCIDGKVTGLWNVGGSAGSIQARSFEAGWQGSFTKAVQEIRTEGSFSGTLAATSVSTLDIGGHMTGANLLIGANLGTDGALGGTGAAADKFTQGSITVFRVNGHVADSSVHVGVNPVDGIFDNGNDLLVGGSSSAITQFVVAGKLLGTTAFVAGAFPSYVRINGQTVRATSVPQLHFSPIDIVGPQVSLALANDSGASATDGITWDPTLNGRVADAGAVSSLKASVDGYAPSLLVNIKPWLQPDGSFVLDEGRLATILGRPLTDGVHTVYVQAIDAAGNTTLRSATFTRDLTVPGFTSFDLAPESDLGTQGDRLTSAPVVAFNGLAEGNTAFELEGLGITGMTNADGTFRVEGVALTEGDNHFTVTFTDLAGNQTFYLQTIRLDNSAPDVVAVLPNDSGRSATDGITNDITLTSIVNDLGGIATIGISVDGGAELVLEGDSLTNLITTLPGYVLEAWAGGLSDGDHTYTVRATDLAGNITEVDLGFVLDRAAPVTPAFDLAPESDTDPQGDGRTKAEVVSLLGTAEGNVDFYLNGSPVHAIRIGDAFRIDGVALDVGANEFTVHTVDAAGNESVFSRTIVREAAVEFGFPDLVASDIEVLDATPDEFGNARKEVRWTTTNVGDSTARGSAGFWTEMILVSFDDIAFNGDEWALDFTFVYDELAPGEEMEHSLFVYDFIDWSNARILVSLDHDVDFNGYYVIGNQVIEKAAGEYNNVTLQDISAGQTPPPVAEWPGTVLPVDGTAIGGTLAAGAQKTYTFTLAGPSRILVDSLSAREDVQITLRAAGGSTLFSHSFATADAFGLGAANPLLQLEAGTYEVVIEGLAPAAEGEFAFRLLDVDTTAEWLAFDGGPQLNERIERGDQTHVYQFQGTEGVQYIVGGPGDSTVDGALFWRLFDPSGEMIWTGTDEPTDILTFGQTGLYTLTVEGRAGKADSTLYNVYAFTPQDRAGELPFFGLPLSTRGFLDAPGQVNTYTFTVSQDTALFFDGSLDVNGDRIAWELQDADGNTIWSGITRKDSGANGTDWPTLQVAAGDYSLRISGIDGAAGWYSFRLMDVLHEPAPTIIPGQVDSGFIAPGYQSNLHRLYVEAGQTVALNIDVTAPDWTDIDAPRWILLDPEGNVRMSSAAEIALPVEFDMTGEWSIIAQGRQDHWTYVAYDLVTFAVAPGIGHQIGLAPSSDTGVIGDGHTALEFVELAGIATPNTALLLAGTGELAFTDADGRYSFHNVQLALGENAIRVQALDGTQANYFTTIVRDEVQPETGFPDLVVNGVWTEQFVDDFGQLMLRVHWTTTNTGTATALGRDGAWAESVHASMDDTPWNGDTWLGALKVTSTLAPGASLEHSIEVAYPSWLPEGFRIYVVTDDEQYIDGFLYANEVAEKTAGEYNNLVIQYIASGIAPAPLPESGPTIALDGTAVGGSLGEGEADAYNFHLDTAATLYFDALTSDGTIWTLREAGAGGAVLFSRSFEASDAFSFSGNPLLQLGAGDYELVIENEMGEAGNYGFRLVDINLAAVPDIVFDGGAIPRQLLERGDWTDIHQFHAEEGRNFVVGGPHDWNIDGALHWRLFDPAGNEIWSGTDSPSDETMFEMTGTYTLLVEGRYGRTDTAQYTAYVFEPQNRDIPLVTGERIQGFIDSPGQINTYHFSLDDDSSLFLDGYLESNGPLFHWTLRDEDGNVIESGNTRSDTTTDGNPRLLTLGPGDYSITIEGQYDSGGWYNFALFDLTHDEGIPLAVGQPAIGTLVPGFNSTMFRFDGQAGQEITIDVNTMDLDWISYDPVHWMVVDEDGAMVASGDDGMSISVDLDQDGSYALLLQAHQYNWTWVQYSVSVTETGAPGVTVELAPESDTGEVGDLHTEQSMVALVGTAAPNALVTLEFLGYATTADETGAFRFENVYLNYGTNPFIVRSLDAEGNDTVTSIEVVLDFPPLPTGSDLVASDIQATFQGTDPSGNQIYSVNWTTTNQGANFASGTGGSWIESVYYSPFDDIIGNEDDILIGSETMYGGLNPGSYLNNTVWAWLSTFTPEGRFYVVVDALNDVIETPEGELNNVTMQA